MKDSILAYTFSEVEVLVCSCVSRVCLCVFIFLNASLGALKKILEL